MSQLPLRSAISDTYPKPTNKQAKEALGAIWDVLSEVTEQPEVEVASATTCDIGGQPSTKLLITGTTTIAGFGTNYRGPILIRMAGALSITHNGSTLICPGGISLTTEAGDILLASPKSTSGTSDGWQVARLNGSGGSAQFISITDYGAIGDGVTNNFQAVTDAMAAASGRKILVPMASSGGDYAVTSGSLTLTGAFEYEAGARIYANGGTVTDNSKLLGFAGESGEGLSRYTRGINAQLLGTVSGSVSVSQVMHHYMRIEGDVLDATTGGGSKSTGCLVDHRFGGTGAKGGRQALSGRLIQDAATEGTNTDRNYTGVIGQLITATGDGGTSGSEKGAYFGLNGTAQLNAGATDTLNVSGAEFNSYVYTGASTKYRTGIQIAMGGDVRGSTKDAGISLYSLGGATIDLKKGIEIGDPATPSKSVVGTDGTVLDVIQTTGITNFLNCVAPVTGKILGYLNGSSDINITPNSFAGNSADYGIEIGRIGTGNTPHIDFHSGAFTTDYDGRISATGGTASNGSGSMTYTAATHSFVGGLKFGTFTTDAAATISGYITITDASGTTRKLLVAA